LLRTLPKSRAANVVGAIAAIGACMAVVLRLASRVRSGHGLDQYTTIFGEQTPLAGLIFIAVGAGVLGAVLLSRVLRKPHSRYSKRGTP
jgi:hypothetical protein